MITYKNEDIFNCNTEIVVNPVNTEGISGKGLALMFKNRFPNNFEKYSQKCKDNEFHIGDILLVKIQNFFNPRGIVNFPTKDKWRYPSRVDYIEKGLKSLSKLMINNNIKSVAIPKLGCGLGELDWDKEVKPLVEKYLKDFDVEVYYI